MNAAQTLTADEIHEERIEAARVAMTEAFAEGDRIMAGRHERVMRALIDLRSPEQVARMESSRGLQKLKGNNE